MKNTLQTKLIFFKLAAAVAVLGACTQAALATPTINFETTQGGYSNAPAAFTTGPANQSSAAFTGNGSGWSQSTSSDVGELITTTNSGDYVGGQALSTTANGGSFTYIGAINLGLTGFTTYTFDIGDQAGASGFDAYVAGFADVNSDGKFSQSEAGPGGGFKNGQFAIRLAGYGTVFSTGVSPTSGDWYHMTVGLNFAANTITLDAIDLTTGSTPVDLNGASVGNTFSVTNAGMFNGVDPSTYTGVSSRSTSWGLVDDINIAAVPEPATTVLLGLGVLVFGIALRRRNAKA